MLVKELIKELEKLDQDKVINFGRIYREGDLKEVSAWNVHWIELVEREYLGTRDDEYIIV